MNTEAVAKAWNLRAQSERVQERRFRRLALQLASVGAEPAVIAMAEKAVEDEKLHRKLCTRLACRFGLKEEGSQEPEIQAIWPPEMPLEDRLLYEITASCCFMESLNASFLMGMHEAAQVPEIKKTVRQILKDEVTHSRIGWAHLAFEQKRRDCRGLSGLLPRMLADTVREELFSPPPPSPQDAVMLAFGELPMFIRLKHMETTLTQVVFLGFDALGIDTSAARSWLSQKRETFN